MAKKLSRVEELRQDCARVGLAFATYGPGDGITRYRFYVGQPGQDFHGCHSIHTALGFKAAQTFAAGFVQGWYACQEGKTPQN
jgi:hypothetical protein